MKVESPALLTVQSSSGLLPVQSFENRLPICDLGSQEVSLSFTNLITNSPANGSYSDNVNVSEVANYHYERLANTLDSINGNSHQHLLSNEDRERFNSVQSVKISKTSESATNHCDEPMLEETDTLTALRKVKSAVEPCVSTVKVSQESPNNVHATFQALNGSSVITTLPSDGSQTLQTRKSPEVSRLMTKQQPNSRSSNSSVTINGNCNTRSPRTSTQLRESKNLSASLHSSSKITSLQCSGHVGILKTYVNDKTTANGKVTNKKELGNGDKECIDFVEDDSGETGVQRQAILRSNCVTVIREVYENGLAREYFAMQLDFALESGVGTIVIEPSRLGRETSQWLAIGTALRLSALVTGSACFISGVLGRDSVCLPCGVISTVLSTLHMVSWRPDPCSRYRVERNTRKLQRLPLHDVTCSAPVVLVKCDNLSLRNSVYDAASVASFMVCIWRLYKWSSA